MRELHLTGGKHETEGRAEREKVSNIKIKTDARLRREEVGVEGDGAEGGGGGGETELLVRGGEGVGNSVSVL